MKPLTPEPEQAKRIDASGGGRGSASAPADARAKVKLRGLPYGANMQDVLTFFRGDDLPSPHSLSSALTILPWFSQGLGCRNLVATAQSEDLGENLRFLFVVVNVFIHSIEPTQRESSWMQ